MQLNVAFIMHELMVDIIYYLLILF